ncbi:hypothetical protein AVEN_71323-1 [Araneus ventricosus]|uniref:Uncharacterized protein n=1 Tax=Araneus ventricosus TaxID=182803 RepID=A0A4Y2BJ96_ARAVE|nr:hypothetical protein AVEN_71323-1 [Araneus ventricosus]
MTMKTLIHKLSMDIKPSMQWEAFIAFARLFCSVLCLHCWDNCNDRKIQVINSDEDDDGGPILPDDMVEASLSSHVEEDPDDLPEDIGP